MCWSRDSGCVDHVTQRCWSRDLLPGKVAGLENRAQLDEWLKGVEAEFLGAQLASYWIQIPILNMLCIR